jgi:hypothetical protein
VGEEQSHIGREQAQRAQRREERISYWRLKRMSERMAVAQEVQEQYGSIYFLVSIEYDQETP